MNLVAFIRRYLTAAYRWALAHKIRALLILIVLGGGGYWGWHVAHPVVTQTYYVMGNVATGTVVASLSESGTVSTTDTVAIQPQVSGQITWVGVQAGDHVKAGQAMVSIDGTTAQQTLAAAKSTYAADQLQFQKDSAQAPISYQSDVDALATAKQNLINDYNSSYNHLTSTYLDLPNVMAGAQETLYGYEFDTHKTTWNMDVLTNMFSNRSSSETTNVSAFKASAKTDYATAKSDYDDAVNVYKTSSRTSSNDQLDALLAQSITMTTAVAQALQSELNFLGAVSDLASSLNLSLPSGFTALQSSTRTYLSTTNNDLSTLLADKKTLDSDKQAIVSAQNAISLDQVGNPNGDNPISLQISKNSLAKEAQAIANQEADLANYTIRAPFSGTVSAVGAQVGNNASGNLVTVISDSQIADISVNEVDAAQIKLGDKATLTFDAIPDLTLTGTVAQVNSVGTVSQGVVSYSLQIAFGGQDPRVKSGMTVTANIQTGVAPNVLVVPATAVKTNVNGESYVLAFANPIPESAIAKAKTGVTSDTPPQQIPVVTGLTDGTQTQIISGLSSGQQIVVSTRSSTAAASAATAATSRSNFGGPAIRGL